MNIKFLHTLFKRMDAIKLKILYQCSIKMYHVPHTCKIYPSRNVGNIKCEGYNTIDRRSVVNHVTLGYASGISRDSYLINVSVGRYTALAPGLKIIYGQHPTREFVSIHPCFYSVRSQYGFTYTDKQKFEESKFADINNKRSVIIGNDVWIASNVQIVEGVIIGNGAIVACGSVVVRDVPPYAIVGGVPAKIIRFRFDKDDVEFLENFKWWDKSQGWIKSHVDTFESIKGFRKAIEDEGN